MCATLSRSLLGTEGGRSTFWQDLTSRLTILRVRARSCPGRHYVTSMLFIVVTTALHTLSITAPLDKDGNPVYLGGKMMPGLIV